MIRKKLLFSVPIYGPRSPYRPLSAAQNDRLSPRTPHSSSAEVFLPRTEATGVADAMINA